MSSAALVRRSTQEEAEEVETKVAPKVLLEVADDDCAMWFESGHPGAGMVIAGCMTTCGPLIEGMFDDENESLLSYDDFGTEFGEYPAPGAMTLHQTDPEKFCEIVTEAAECIKMPAVVEEADLCPTIKSCFVKEACPEQEAPSLIDESSKVADETAQRLAYVRLVMSADLKEMKRKREEKDLARSKAAHEKRQQLEAAAQVRAGDVRRQKLKVNAGEKEIDESSHRVGQEEDNMDLIELATEFPGHSTIGRGISSKDN